MANDREGFRSLFEDYVPNPPIRFERLGWQSIRRATLRDLEAIGKLFAERHGHVKPNTIARLRQAITASSDNCSILVAEVRANLVAYAESAYFQPPPDAPANAAPEGWYLLGIIVSKRFRRRGLGSALTHARLQALATVAESAYYFANARNRVSIDLHRPFGFREISRDFWYPGVEFQGGVGILFRTDLVEFRELATQ